MMLPFSILPYVLAASFLLTWGYVVWLECRHQMDAASRDGEAPGGVVYFGGGTVGRTCDSPARPTVKMGVRRPTIRAGTRSTTPVTLHVSYGTSSRTVPLPKREGNISLRRVAP
ncbi:MAG TPA: hypothetical protein VHK01_03560 [Lacipirellulaceae bacterium]|jgi:hypothetical protein|nr:hypothetical protein [Lacipirellulaceae bacterium]